ncbi:MAG: glycosyltransferase family 4 protein [Myxococcota bacterium]
MRIALIVERFAPSPGGVEQVVWTVAHGLRDAGCRVRVLARLGEPVPGIELERVDAPRFWQPARVALFTRGVARRVARLRARDEVDVVHSFCRTLSQDVFHAGGGCHAESMRSTYGPRGARWRRVSPRHALQLELDRRIFADPAQIVQCPSAMVAREIRDRFGVAASRLAVVRNGVHVGRFARTSETAAAALRREILGDATDAAVWLLAGSGWRRKGLDTALAAIAGARDRRARLWVAGADRTAPWRARAEQLGIGDRVVFLGARADMERVYAAADGLLLPTRYDAFGLVCLEAAAAGRPVVTSTRAGAAEVLEGCGEVVDDPEDASAFALALDRLADPEERRTCGEAGRKAAAGLDWPLQIEALQRLYAGIAS